MTDSDIKTLKSYLTECLESQLKRAADYAEHYEACENGTIKTLDAELATHMRRFYEGQMTALKNAIDEFKELFEEELKEGE